MGLISHNQSSSLSLLPYTHTLIYTYIYICISLYMHPCRYLYRHYIYASLYICIYIDIYTPLFISNLLLVLFASRTLTNTNNTQNHIFFFAFYCHAVCTSEKFFMVQEVNRNLPLGRPLDLLEGEIRKRRPRSERRRHDLLSQLISQQSLQ